MIAISIVTHGQSELVRELLDDIIRIRPGLVTHIVITHNLSDDRLCFPSSIDGALISQIHNSVPKGFGANHNSAFQLVREPYFAVLNPDLRINSDPFGVLVRRFDDLKVVLVAPQVLNLDGSVADSARGLYTPIASIMGLLGSHRLRVNPVWVGGMFMLLRSSAYREVNGFDERYFMYVEDVDICSRLTMSGGSILYDPAVSVIHDARRANRKSLKHLKWHARSALRWWGSHVFWRHLRQIWFDRKIGK
jgi:N-acetylglucosaminyl-diphospho-decaprenol L-rhamnosyltransferase